ncbi:MAG: hypothetical protein WA802_02795 [Terracidiphilus sp.]|jgi:hypothetical protein
MLKFLRIRLVRAACAAETARGDLEAEEELSGGSFGDRGGADGIEDLVDRGQDSAAVCQCRQRERLLVNPAMALHEAARRGVEEAVGHAAHGGRVTLGACRHDVTTFLAHNPTPTCCDSVKK